MLIKALVLYHLFRKQHDLWFCISFTSAWRYLFYVEKAALFSKWVSVITTTWRTVKWIHFLSSFFIRSLDCTLFTMCRDGVGRFWSPTDVNVPYRLFMCAVIDPSQSLVTSDSSASNCSSSHHSTTTTTTSIDDHAHKHTHHLNDEFSPIHYIGCDELRNAINVYKLRQASSKHPQYLDQQLDKVKDLIRDTPDLLFRLQPDGSIIFWGVQVIDLYWTRIPSCSLSVGSISIPGHAVSRKPLWCFESIKPFTPRTVPSSYRMSTLSTILPTSSLSVSDTTTFFRQLTCLYVRVASIKPVELSLLARNPHGELRCYGLNLVDFLDSTSFEPRLRLKYSWAGHQLPITSIHQTHINQFSTISQDGYINIWKYGLHQVSRRG